MGSSAVLAHPTRRRRASRLAAGLAVVVLGLAAFGSCQPTTPTLSARTLVSGRSHVWDLTFTPSGSILWTERGGGIFRRTTDGAVNQMDANLSDLYVSGETGLMGIVVDPRFSSNRRIYTCQGFHDGTAVPDVRVYPWVASTDGRSLQRLAPIVTHLSDTWGRHGGCRLRFDSQRRLYIGTGDAADGARPQDLTSHAGKVLRVNPDTGAGSPGNPFASSSNARTRRIWSWGHRNVQGLAIRPADGTLWSVEHGPDRDDEVNRGVAGNFGWDPVPGYNESVPMTDLVKFPSAKRAAWTSGATTVATSGSTWLTGSRWEAWNDRMVVATLKGSSLLVLRPQRDGTLTQIARVYQGTFGRIRTAQLGPDGLLYITTDNGSNDRIIRITPS
jgi:glucose/arabinose dehydrogenase